jgi:hypothetical protein
MQAADVEHLVDGVAHLSVVVHHEPHRPNITCRVCHHRIVSAHRGDGGRLNQIGRRSPRGSGRSSRAAPATVRTDQRFTHVADGRSRRRPARPRVYCDASVYGPNAVAVGLSTTWSCGSVNNLHAGLPRDRIALPKPLQDQRIAQTSNTCPPPLLNRSQTESRPR